MSDSCRFDPAVFARPMPAVDARGYPCAHVYNCPSCGRAHWCTPAAEADGDAASAEECTVPAFAALVAAGLLLPGAWLVTTDHLDDARENGGYHE